MYIKLYLSEQEKKRLENIATAKKVSVSKLCYEQVLPLLSGSFLSVDDFECGTGNSNDENLKYDRCVKVYFSDKEYQALLKGAKGIPLSRYMRNLYLSRLEPVEISVYTDDISALTMKVSGYIEQFHNFIAALAIRRQLYEADYNRLIQIADDMKKALRDVANFTKANRASIRSSGVRILRKEIKKALEKQLTGKDGDIRDSHM